jgi:hypothetical protein
VFVAVAYAGNACHTPSVIASTGAEAFARIAAVGICFDDCSQADIGRVGQNKHSHDSSTRRLRTALTSIKPAVNKKNP